MKYKRTCPPGTCKVKKGKVCICLHSIDEQGEQSWAITCGNRSCGDCDGCQAKDPNECTLNYLTTSLDLVLQGDKGEDYKNKGKLPAFCGSRNCQDNDKCMFPDSCLGRID